MVVKAPACFREPLFSTLGEFPPSDRLLTVEDVAAVKAASVPMAAGEGRKGPLAVPLFLVVPLATARHFQYD